MVEITLVQKDCCEALAELKNAIRTDRSEVYIIHFEADHANSKIIRDFVGAIFDAHNIHRPWRGRFILIADELINNAIEHGSTPGDIDSCAIEAGKTEDGGFFIRLEVHDTGRGKDTSKPEAMEKIRAEKKAKQHEVSMEKRGRGLFHITDKLVDRLSFSESMHGGLKVSIEKFIHASEFDRSKIKKSS